MRAISSIASITVHCGVAAAFLFGTARTGRSNPARPPEITIMFPSAQPPIEESGPIVATGPAPLWIDVDRVPIPDFRFDGGSTTRTTLAPFLASVPSSLGTGLVGAWVDLGAENAPQVLSGPLPLYPELLRQAGVEGRVVLEAIVDTTGRVRRDSVLVVSTTSPEFVAPTRQALVATLFRPAFVAGRAVRTRIRIPFEFTIQDGRGHPR
jgi:periplasmic protein TonB